MSLNKNTLEGGLAGLLIMYSTLASSQDISNIPLPPESQKSINLPCYTLIIAKNNCPVELPPEVMKSFVDEVITVLNGDDLQPLACAEPPDILKPLVKESVPRIILRNIAETVYDISNKIAQNYITRL